MNIWQKHVEYLKDNPDGYWFKRKLYGYGWTPARWQGWVVVLVFLILAVANFYRLEALSSSIDETLNDFIPQTLVLIFILILICIKKGEKPRWQWGIYKEDKDKSL
ncbi:MAG: hypothetical protein R3B53_00095 [Candidatus Paceibacterota bacterium]